MGLILLVLLLALILGGLGFAVHILWWIALIVLVVWLLGFLIRVGEGAGRGRWYRWLPGGDGATGKPERMARPVSQRGGATGSLVSRGRTRSPRTATTPARHAPRR
jgi:hypothetical protein